MTVSGFSRRSVFAGSAGVLAAAGVAGSAAAATGRASGSSIWRGEDVALLLVDYQPEVLAQIRGADPRVVELNARLLARMAMALDVPVVLTTVGVAIGINGPTVPSLVADLPGVAAIDRSTMNAWEDRAFRRAVRATNRRRLVIGGIYSEICVAFPTVHAIDDGYEVAFIGDAIAGQSLTAHEMAVARMTQAGAVPSTAVAMVLEWFRDWRSPQAAEAGPILQWYNAELATTEG